MHSSEKYVVIIIFRMAICHLFPSSYLLLLHSWCCKAGWEKTVVGVQVGWRTAVWAKASDRRWWCVKWGGCDGAECDSEQTSALTKIVFWLASHFTVTVFSSLPSVWMIFHCFIHLQELQQIISSQHEWQDTFKISTQHSSESWWHLVQTMWLDYQKLMVSDTVSMQTDSGRNWRLNERL